MRSDKPPGGSLPLYSIGFWVTLWPPLFPGRGDGGSDL